VPRVPERRSANGWTVLESPPPPVEVPGTDIKVRVRPGDVATVLTYVAARFHAEVERLDLPVEEDPGRDEWGWAWRPIRGQSSGFSNHAAGCAIDLNATRHPRGVRSTFTAAQKRAVRKILASTFDAQTGRNVVRWGEDYRTTVDGMHFEIDATPAAVARVAQRIRAKQAEQAAADAVPTPEPTTLEDGMFIANVAGPDKRAFLVNPPFKMLLAKNVADELRAKGVKDIGDMTAGTLNVFATVDTSSVAELVEVVPGQVAELHQRRQP
jgi:hypothetical protein